MCDWFQLCALPRVRMAADVPASINVLVHQVGEDLSVKKVYG